MMSTRNTVILILTALLVVFAAILSPKMFEDVQSGEIVVIQKAFSGELKVVTEPGVTWQGFGSVTRYPRRNEFNFDGKESASLNVRFYDGGVAQLFGTISWNMPLDEKSIIEIHRDFRSPEAFETQAIRRSMESASTFSGPTMTAFESAAGRRNELLQILNDQTANGVYKTYAKKVIAKDVAGVEKEMTLIEIVKDEKGLPARAQNSYVKEYKVDLLPMTISSIKYEDRVEKQIQQQQDATNAAVVAKANAAKAEQDSITIEAQGRAAATRTKWEQEQINAKTVAEADARVKIADAAAKEAELFKKAEILKGEGEARRKELVMSADGQLDKKLEALKEINRYYADAIAKAQPGAWAPGVQMGGAGQSGGDRATGLVDLLTAKTARDLSVDLGVAGKAATKK
jgi:regulator of protease activity HflC (stomatin/prohibitin superfamily)